MYYIVFPGGDRDKLCLVNLSESMAYEINDYDVASRREFYDDQHDEAVEYAKKLAFDNGLKYEGDDDGYLD